MLSDEKNIRTPRQLCKVVTGRTSASPLAVINKVLARLEKLWMVKATRSSKKTSYGPAVLRLEAETGDRRSLYTKEVAFPLSYKDFVMAILDLDTRGEQGTNSGYGARQG